MYLVIYYLIALIFSMHLFNYFVDSDASNLLLLSIGFICGFLCYGSIALLGIMAMEFTPSSFSGSSHAIASLAANFGAIMAGVPFGLLSFYFSFNHAFKIVEFLTLFIVLFMIVFRNSKSRFELSFAPAYADLERKNQQFYFYFLTFLEQFLLLNKILLKSNKKKAFLIFYLAAVFNQFNTEICHISK